MNLDRASRPGAFPDNNGTRFGVWAPDVKNLEVVIYNEQGQIEICQPLVKDADGYFSGYLAGIGAGRRYKFRLDGDRERPDPASRFQPEGVHGPSQIVDPAEYRWRYSANWQGRPLEELVIYEAHVGTATPAGTFEGLIEKLDYIRSLGATALEIMPVADFPGQRNWGYDGVSLYAPSRAYGGPDSLKRLVDAAHGRGLAVVLDVVYNHLGPDGNYLRDFSRDYFTDEYKTPWGDAINYAAGPVREFFLDNALYWVQEYNLDGLRLDATHAILDPNERHFLAELAERVRAGLPEGRHFAIMAEDERNEVALLRPAGAGGAGLDGVWADDFHHQVRSALAGDNEGYYRDYSGTARDLAATLNQGWFFTGQSSDFLGHSRGTEAGDCDPASFVYCIQNHDQIGNRPLGDRLNHSISPAAYRLASALLLLSPGTPLLFQGQEWAASTPFLFFTDHEPELGRLVTEGRRAEFKDFAGFKGHLVPDPQDRATFDASKLNWDEPGRPGHAEILKLYRDLLKIRFESPTLLERSRASFEALYLGGEALALYYRPRPGEAAWLGLINLKGATTVQLDDLPAAGEQLGWKLRLASNDPQYGGQEDRAAIEASLKTGTINLDGPAAYLFQAIS